MTRDDAGSGGPGDLAAQVHDFVAGAWDPECSLLAWRGRLFEAGWAMPTWPLEWGGRALSVSDGARVSEALVAAGVPGAPESVGTTLAAPTLLAHGSDLLRARFLRPIATGAEVWCQLFSEPGAGSDLAGLSTRADLDGDEWIVTGQKVWNTGAKQASFGLLLARTDWDVPKHHGITYFVLPMHQPGVDVRPLRQMNGHQSFNEVFLDEVRIPADHVLGDVGAGWTGALTTLAHERRLARPRQVGRRREPDGRVWREATAEGVAASEPHRWYPQRAGRVDLLVERARATGTDRDPLVRQAIASVHSLALTARWTAQRAVAARARGLPPGPEGSLGKLATSVIARAASRAHAQISGADGMLTGPSSPLGGTIAEIFVSVPAQSIAGGTDEIQRTILAERVLGLPREPTGDRDVPFRSLPRNG